MGSKLNYSRGSSALCFPGSISPGFSTTIRECARKSVAIECVILYAKGYNYDEISKMLRIPKGTVMSRISNGRKMLREALDG